MAGNIVRALLPVLYDAADRWQVDIALCVKEGPDYAAAIKARKAFGEEFPATRVWPWKGTDGLPENAADLADRAKKGELVLFLGAGVSAGAGLPIWKQLLETLSIIAVLSPEAGNSDDTEQKTLGSSERC